MNEFTDKVHIQDQNHLGIFLKILEFEKEKERRSSFGSGFLSNFRNLLSD
jgi:hypothetical protein